MTKCRGIDCPNEIEEATVGRPREWCTEACRKRNAARSGAIPTTQPGSAALDGLTEWLQGRTGLPSSLVSVALALAAQCDARPSQPALWSRYQRALEDLEYAAAERERAGLAFVEDLRSEMRTIDETEHYRAGRYREAMDRGDEDEMRRWERLVPLGCSLGNHRWHQWPAGLRMCVDCRLEEN